MAFELGPGSEFGTNLKLRAAQVRSKDGIEVKVAARADISERVLVFTHVPSASVELQLSAAVCLLLSVVEEAGRVEPVLDDKVMLKKELIVIVRLEICALIKHIVAARGFERGGEARMIRVGLGNILAIGRLDTHETGGVRAGARRVMAATTGTSTGERASRSFVDGGWRWLVLLLRSVHRFGERFWQFERRADTFVGLRGCEHLEARFFVPPQRERRFRVSLRRRRWQLQGQF